MEISQFYDVNKRTQTEQVLKNMEDIKDLQDKDTEIEQSIEDETQARTEADETLAYDLADLQEQVNSFGNVFTLKGSVATISDLPATDNNVGDVWYVEAEAVGYVWIDDNGTERWEQLGMPVDLSNYVTTTDLATTLEDYQGKLTAGTNISIIGNTISATQPNTSKFEMLSGVSAPSTSTIGAVGQKYLDTTKNDIYICTTITDNGDNTFSYTWLLLGGNGKQNKLTAGTNISIDGNNVISASGGLTEVKASDVNSESATAGQVLTADGSGGASFGNVPAPTGVLSLDNSTQEFDGDKIIALKQYRKFKLYNKTQPGSFFEIYMKGANNYGTQLNIGDMSGSVLHLNFPYGSTRDINMPTKSGNIALISDINTKVPDAPTTDGTYVLKVVVSSGVPTYQWVLES